MLFREPLPFINSYIEDLSQTLASCNSGKGLSSSQRDWLSFCLMGILITNKVCWAEFERASLGTYKESAQSWMFCHSPLDWFELFHSSIATILAQYNITNGVLVLDDTDHQRAKITSRIYHAHKIFDKKRSGYFNGQSIVFLLLVTEKMTIPVGFDFYRPDPVIQAWNKEDKKLRKAGIKKAQRPAEPKRNPDYKTKKEISIQLTEQFIEAHPQILLKGHLGDNLYSTAQYLDKVAELIKGQAVSQLRNNQNVLYKGKEISVTEYFRQHPPLETTITIRGGEEKKVLFECARLFVPSHGKKRFVIALKYEEQEEYRYLVATDLSWRGLDIVEFWTLRWLVEVFIQDFKSYEGWGQLAKQPDEEGSRRSLTLSLLLDHCLFLHPSQRARFESKTPAWTVGSLLRKARAESIVEFIRPMLISDEGHEKIEQLSKSLEQVFALRESSKHMSGRELGRQESTPSLRYYNQDTG